MASDLDKLILQPENEANLSRTEKSSWKEPKSPCKKQVVSSANKLIFFSVLPHLNSLYIIIIANCNGQNFNCKKEQKGWNWAALKNPTWHINRLAEKPIIDNITFSAIVEGFDPLNKIITKVKPR